MGRGSTKVEVFIGGISYKLSASESEEYIKEVADYIDKKMSEIMALKPSGAVSQTIQWLLLSLNIADELFKLEASIAKNQSKESEVKESKSELENRLENYYEEFHKMQEENALLKEKLTELQLEIKRLHSDLSNNEKP